MTSATSPGSTLARRSASAIATLPRACAPAGCESAPLKAPIGVRAAPTMTTSVMDFLLVRLFGLGVCSRGSWLVSTIPAALLRCKKAAGRAQPFGQGLPHLGLRALAAAPSCRYGPWAARRTCGNAGMALASARAEPAARCGPGPGSRRGWERRALRARPAGRRAAMRRARWRSRHTRRPGIPGPPEAASGTPSFSQSSSATNWRASLGCRIEAGEAQEFAQRQAGIERGEQRLDDIDRQLAQRCRAAARSAGGQGAEQPRPAPPARHGNPRASRAAPGRRDRLRGAGQGRAPAAPPMQ